MYNREKIIDVMQEIYDESKAIAPYVLIAQPRRDLSETPAQNFNGYHGLHIDLCGFSHGYINIGGEKVDVARNYLMEQALNSGAKYLLFIGEDTVLPYDGFKTLLKTAEANPNSIVTGVYYIKCSDAMIMVREKDWITIPNVDPGQLIEAWQTGMDVMLIPIEILKQMKEEAPDLPFCCIGNSIEGKDGLIPFIGEDNFFVHRIHKKGVKLLVDTNVQCLHIDLASGMYTAHPDVDIKNYFTNIPISRPLTLDDKEYIDNRWIKRIPKGSNSKDEYMTFINELKENGKPVKFNMGSGRDVYPDYISIDKYSAVADIQEDLFTIELPENCADEILASHVIEHLPQFQAPVVMKKWYETLKPGGKLIMELPDLEGLCKDFLEQSEEERFITTMCIYGASGDCVNEESIRNGTSSPHLWGYTPSNISSILNYIGFKDIEILPSQGPHPGKNFRIETIK